MSILENFKNIPRSPYGGRQGSNVIFSSSNLQQSPCRKKKRGLSPIPGAADQWAQPTGARGAGRPSRGRQGGLSPPRRPGQPSLYKASPSFPPHLTSKNPPKIQKKERGEEKGSGEALPNSALVIYR